MTLVAPSVRRSCSHRSTVMSRSVHQLVVSVNTNSEIHVSTMRAPVIIQNQPLARSSRGSGGFSPDGRRRRPVNRSAPIRSSRRAPMPPSSLPSRSDRW